MRNKLHHRFQELADQAKQVAATGRIVIGLYGSPEKQVDDTLLLNWKVKARSLLLSACGRESPHVEAFIENETGSFASSSDILERLEAVFLAAKEDYEGGYLRSVRSLITAEIFDSELDQAKELLNKSYYVAAAVIAGTVLETSLRALCQANAIEMGSLDRMNNDLTKKDVYNKLVHKSIVALAAIRNSAAHGRTDEFTAAAVPGMIADIERFVIEHGA